MSKPTPKPTSTLETIAKEITEFVDNLGSGLSSEHEAKLTTRIVEILKRHGVK